MVARTRAAKREAKRGRPPLPANLNTREPNGRLSRRQERTLELEHEIVSTAGATRMRHLKLASVEQARNPRYGYLLGRIRMDGQITEEQHDAGQRYAEDMARYYGLTGVPFPSAKSAFLFSVKPWEERADKHSLRTSAVTQEERIEDAKRVRAKMVALRDILLACGDVNTARRVLHTVNAVCVEDLDHLRNLNPPMLKWLKLGLNALDRFYSTGRA